jgi:L-arabinokinase
VRRAAQHPVDEQARVDRFAELLAVLPHQPHVAHELGSLMYGSHESYGACGLGSDGTDRLVELVRAADPKRGIFGAKITGGGSGGTVAILGTVEAEHHVRDIAARYANETGRKTQVFAESGPGVTLQIDDSK